MFTTIGPRGDYYKFDDEQDYMKKLKDWGLVSASAKSPKHEFHYKRENSTYTVMIKGYEISGAHETAVVSFTNDALHCVHPAYLKEMQSPSFGRESVINTGEDLTSGELPVSLPVQEGESTAPKTKTEPKAKKEKKPQIPVLDLPGDKVSFEAVVKEFTTKYNHFNETEEEIVILEQVKVTGDSPLEVGEAWCGYSKTLKKLELEIGNSLTFDAKIVDRKLNKDIRYKINNPSKIKIKE
ncbi:hypothetical protein JOC77_003365 [Peribacillus deserti]|uniref:Uncharacterized protein n=1 Tax=Peribacillus deserti TaxID=673318 RepID=A0ABS2QL78_9BACI|nr:hypothetical protein [Peribacillus deserti]MBM7693921.1 hypothetical protein [Peribacillus deserti]